MISELERQTLGDIVSANYRAAEIFERHGLDFCCGGRISLGDACRDSDLDPDAVVAELRALDKDDEPIRATRADELVAEIIQRHHGYVRTAVPTIQRHLEKVRGAHGERHPELAAIVRHFSIVATDLILHMMKEEQLLFPYIRALASSAEGSAAPPPDVFGTVQNPIRMMEIEHQHAGDEMATIRSLANGYEPPVDACTTYRLVYAELRDFERDLHRHVHLENNVLFPRAVELESEIQRKAQAPCRGPR